MQVLGSRVRGGEHTSLPPLRSLGKMVVVKVSKRNGDFMWFLV